LWESDYLETLITYFLPLAYAIFFGWLVLRSHILRDAGFPKWFILFFFAGKILIGILYTWVMLQFIPTATQDIELFFGGGLEMYQVFWKSPASFPQYLAQTFTISDFNIGETDSDFIRTVFDGIKFIHFLLNFLSGGELFTNVLLFNCLAAWLFLRCWVYLKNILGQSWLGAWVFLFPSAFFFTSVILKEGIELLLISAIIPLLYRFSQKRTIGRVLGLLLLFFLLFFFKYLVAATFSASLVLFYLFRQFPAYRKWIAGLAVTSFLILFFNAGYIHPSLDLPQYIIERRLEFLALEANTELVMRPLEPTALSFAKALPESVHNVLFRPWPGQGGKLTYLIFSAEIMAFWCLMAWLVLRKKKFANAKSGPEGWAFLLFALVNLLIIGYTITNIGAIIRYRSIFMPGIGYFVWMCYGGQEFFLKITGRFSRFF
jgi:hypothetical protein